MRFGTLNINGCRDAVKRFRLFDYIMMKRGSIVFLQETHTDLNNQVQWQSDWKGQVILSHGSSVSAGVAILFGPEYKEHPVSVFELVPGRMLRVDITVLGLNFSLFNVYAPNIGSDRILFFKKLKTALSDVLQDRMVVLAGDFNCTINHTLDRNHEEPHKQSSEELKTVLTYHGLVDVWREAFPQTKQYTWLKVNANMISGARLDRIYVQKSVRGRFFKSCIMPTALSDHQYMSVEVSSAQSTFKHSLWKFNSRLLQDHNFAHSFTFFWEMWRESKMLYKSLSQWWDIGKTQIKLFCQNYAAYDRSILENTVKQLEQDILYTDDKADEVDIAEILERNTFLLRNLLEERAQETLVRARFTNSNNMDASTSFFFNLEKKTVNKKILCHLKLPGGGKVTDERGIMSHALSFYEDLYKAEPCDEEMADILLKDLPQLTEEEKSRLDQPLTFAELTAAVQELSSGKVPGLDGLNAEFYKQFWSVIGKDLFSVFLECLERGTLPVSLRRAGITLLPKKGDLGDIKNWRPVSLLGVDYKIFSKALTNRLKCCISSVIHVDQAYCIPNRSIFDNLFFGL